MAKPSYVPNIIKDKGKKQAVSDDDEEQDYEEDDFDVDDEEEVENFKVRITTQALENGCRFRETAQPAPNAERKA